jgi:hypothetical protein
MQCSVSKEKKDLGLIDGSDSTYTDIFHDYSTCAPTGKWALYPWKQCCGWGGSGWLRSKAGRQKKVSDEDRSYLVSEAFNNWFTGLTTKPDLKVNTDMMTDKMSQFALDRVDK